MKEGKGGQRDLQTLFWIAKFVYRVKTLEGLVEAGVFTRREMRLFERCEEFLWRVRCHMHFVAKRPRNASPSTCSALWPSAWATMAAIPSARSSAS